MICMAEYFSGIRQLQLIIDNIVSTPIKKAFEYPVAGYRLMHKHYHAIDLNLLYETSFEAAQAKAYTQFYREKKQQI